MRSRPARVADVHAVASGLPHVTVVDGSSGNPVYQVGGKSFVYFRTPRPDAVDPATGERYADVIVLWVPDEGDKQALVEDGANPFFTTSHFDGHPSVLVRGSRLGELTVRQLTEVIEDAWCSRASRRRVESWLASRSAGSTGRTTDVLVRAAVPADAEALARCHLACWREAYGDLVDPARLAPYLADVDAQVRRWEQTLGSPARVRIAVEDGSVVGFATVRPTAGDGPAHLGAIYVRRGRWSTGLGQRLLDAALGDEAATLQVFRDNARARRFYARNGFVPDGTEGEEPHFGGVEIGMVRPLRT